MRIVTENQSGNLRGLVGGFPSNNQARITIASQRNCIGYGTHR